MTILMTTRLWQESKGYLGDGAVCLLLLWPFRLFNAAAWLLEGTLYVDGYVLLSKPNIVNGDLPAAKIGVSKVFLTIEQIRVSWNNLKLLNRQGTSLFFARGFQLYPSGVILTSSPLSSYSNGNNWHGLPELWIVYVPNKSIPDAVDIIGKQFGFEGACGRQHRHVELDGNRAQVLMVSEEANRSVITNMIGNLRKEVEVSLLKRLGVENEPEPSDGA